MGQCVGFEGVAFGYVACPTTDQQSVASGITICALSCTSHVSTAYLLFELGLAPHLAHVALSSQYRLPMGFCDQL